MDLPRTTREGWKAPRTAVVDETWNRLTGAGHHGRMAPGTQTGLYAALVDDPDGNVVLISSDPAANPAGV